MNAGAVSINSRTERRGEEMKHKLRPKKRHLAILRAIKRHQPCCTNLLWQASGVINYKRPCADLVNAGLIRWQKATRLFASRSKISGYVMTDEGNLLVPEVASWHMPPQVASVRRDKLKQHGTIGVPC